jgi:hypothetical protein
MLAFAQNYNELLTHIITDFYDHLVQDKSANKILSALSPTEQQHLKARQAQPWNKRLDTELPLYPDSAALHEEMHRLFNERHNDEARSIGFELITSYLQNQRLI